MPRASASPWSTWGFSAPWGCSWLQILRPPYQGESASNRAAHGAGREGQLWGEGPSECHQMLLGLEYQALPCPLLPCPYSLTAFPAASILIWSQVNLWHNPAWKYCQLPSNQKEAASQAPSAVCCLLALSLPEPQGARSQPGRPRLAEWGHLYRTLYSPHLALKVCSRNVSSALNLSKPGKCHSLSLSKADS